MSTNPISNRTEIVFVYDISDANPNGDPNDENRPRMDLEAGCAKVSDVRLKRTIRDYMQDYDHEEIFCREIEKDDGTLQQGKDRAEDFFKTQKAKSVLEKRSLIEQAVIQSCIDVRLFGATIPISKTKQNEKDSSVTLTGPVQFAMGTSLHRVEPRFIKGTGAFASGQGAQQRTFREEYVLPYALITFYGIVNEQAAKTTLLSSADAEKLYAAIWYGTKNLISRSKIGQRPLLLLLVEYNEGSSKSYIGRLDRFLQIIPAIVQSDASSSVNGFRDEGLRDVAEVKLNLAQLQDAVNAKKDKIGRIRFAWDSRLKLSHIPEESDRGWSFLGIPAERLTFD